MADGNSDGSGRPLGTENTSTDGQQERLKRHVRRLAVEIGPRNLYHYEALQKAATYIESVLAEAGHSELSRSMLK